MFNSIKCLRKSTRAISTVLLGILALNANYAVAARTEKQQVGVELSAVGGSALVGALVGGPVGFAFGSLGGVLLAEQTKKSNDKAIEVEKMQASLIELENTIEEKQHKIATLEQSTVDSLALQIMFSTGDDKLEQNDRQRIKLLADYLKKNPKLVVNLDGHADPRGTDEYNNVLSLERAKSVKKELVNAGITEPRIILHSHGSNFSTASKGDLDGYALERKVEIELVNPDNKKPIVQH